MVKHYFNVEKISLQGGGIIDGAILAQGLISELSLVIYPGIEGLTTAPSIFEYLGHSEERPAEGQSLELISVEQKPHGIVWLRYKFLENKIINIRSIAEYNTMLGVDTLHPLVSVINLTEAKPMRHLRHTFSFYTVFLKEVKCGDLIYGRQTYDYQEGTVVCVAPGQIIGIEDNGEVFQPKGWALCFHPNLIRGTSLGSHINEYSFFSYAVNEALHLSKKEREVFVDCIHKIQLELNHDIDRMTQRLIATNIELLLDYCLRFYERQFITREVVNSDILARFERLIHNYFEEGRQVNEGIPTVSWCASELCLSPKYFSDLMKKETGHTAIEHIQTSVIEISKEKLFSPTLSISEIAYQLGFQYPAHFSRMFKKIVGKTPNEYRLQISTN